MKCLCQEYQEGYTDGISEFKIKMKSQLKNVINNHKLINTENMDTFDYAQYLAKLECLGMVLKNLEDK